MRSFDQALKTLLQQAPADFIRFALRGRRVEVISPLPNGLPARGRDIDGGYLAALGGEEVVAHIEFHRRHQSLDDLALDIGEAQIRFYRRERKRVLSIVWDLYGREDEPVLEVRALDHGVALDAVRTSRVSSSKGSTKERRGSRAVYVRVNLRGQDWKKLLAKGPPALWPLVALCRGGACEEAVREASDAIRRRADLPGDRCADHLAALWFVAEKEDVSVQVMQAYISEQELMASVLYKTILQKGKAEGKAEANAEALVRLLTRALGALDDALQERLRHVTDPAMLQPWLEEAWSLEDSKAARRLARKIQKALPA